jgi:hypothetical protein
MGRTPNQISPAAGISRLSHFVPPYNAAIPRRMRMTVELTDFFASALIIPPSGLSTSGIRLFEI